MKVAKLRALVRCAPFRPFEISLENGERYRIRHPESIAMARHSVVVFLPNNEVDLVVFDAAEVACFRRLARNGR